MLRNRLIVVVLWSDLAGVLGGATSASAAKKRKKRPKPNRRPRKTQTLGVRKTFKEKTTWLTALIRLHKVKGETHFEFQITLLGRICSLDRLQRFSYNRRCCHWIQTRPELCCGSSSPSTGDMVRSKMVRDNVTDAASPEHRRSKLESNKIGDTTGRMTLRPGARQLRRRPSTPRTSLLSDNKALPDALRPLRGKSLTTGGR